MRRRDPLLTAARALLLLSMGLTLIGALVFVIGFSAVAVMQDSLIDTWRSVQIGPRGVPIILAVIALLALATGLGFFFLRHLYRMVGTVEQGDPFLPVNARRLQAMGWLALAIDGLLIAALALGDRVDTAGSTDRADFNFALGGLVLSLVLFVIARVFREGARMREELEGTV